MVLSHNIRVLEILLKFNMKDGLLLKMDRKKR
jgi:hypothetical protein